jgi:hypothetical protein
VPKKDKVKVWEVECSEWECDEPIWCKGGIPDECPKCGGAILRDTAKEITVSYDDYREEGYATCVSPRPAWDKGRQEDIRKRASSPGGTIYCQICGEEIEVNEEGKEEWTSKSGNDHETLPHTDHCLSPGGSTGGEWHRRKRALEQTPGFGQLPENEQKRRKKEVFNASPLRTAHMMCNCSRPEK